MATEMNQIYQEPGREGSLGGIDALFRAVRGKVKKKEVEEWLKSQSAYTLHKPVRRNFPRNRVIVGRKDQQWQADLADVSNLSRHNNGYRYLLTCIDIFSKYAWVIPLKQKSGSHIVKAFSQIFQERKPFKLQTDKGTEFKNAEFQKFLKKHGVHFFTTNNETKASVVERFNRTIKTKMWHYFSSKNTYKYIDVLDQLVHGYNHSFHRSIKMRPVEVSEANQKKVWENLYGNLETEKPIFTFQEGDHVRISKSKLTFEKGYESNWTDEVFVVTQCLPRTPPVYKVKDLMNEEIEGTFYAQELQKVKLIDSYPIEKILKKRKRKGKMEYFVKFRGYPEKFNAWTPAQNLTSL